MQLISFNSNQDYQWQAYQQLELLPGSTPNPNAKTPKSIFGVERIWQKLISLLVEELVAEQQVEYLERCWKLDEFGQKNQPHDGTLQRLWKLMN